MKSPLLYHVPKYTNCFVFSAFWENELELRTNTGVTYPAATKPCYEGFSKEMLRTRFVVFQVMLQLLWWVNREEDTHSWVKTSMLMWDYSLHHWCCMLQNWEIFTYLLMLKLIFKWAVDLSKWININLLDNLCGKL